MSVNWGDHETQLGPVPRTNYGLPVVSSTDPLADARRAGGWNEGLPQQLGAIRDVLVAPLIGNNDRSPLGNAQALLVRKEL